MNWAGYTILSLILISIGISMAKHGEPRTDKYNFFTTLVSNAILVTLYYFGGLF